MAAANFDPNLLSPDQTQHIIEKIHCNLLRDNDHSECLIWQLSCCTAGYGQIRLGQDISHLFQTKVHNPCRLLYSLFHNKVLDTPGFEMSHLCHNKKCLCINHLNYEPRTINQQRKTCNDSSLVNKICVGHGDYPNCIF